jgi:hypothetical protein
MGTQRTTTLVTLLGLALLTACTSGDKGGDDTGGVDDTGDTQDTGGTETTTASSASFAAKVAQGRAALVQTIPVTIGASTTATGAKGTSVIFGNGTIVDAEGQPATGTVDVTLLELTDRGSMLAAGMPTTGLTADGSHATLASGGEQFVDLSQGGEPLHTNGNFTITIPTELTGGTDGDMSLFLPEVEGAALEDEILWEEATPEAGEEPDRDFGIGKGEADADYYWISSDSLGWTNVDKWYDDERPKTSIEVAVPEGWDGENADVYLTYDGEGAVLARLDVYDSENALFTEHYGLLPIGLEVHVIFLSVDEGEDEGTEDDQFLYGIQGATIVDGEVISFDSSDGFVTSDLDGLVGAINALP